MKTTTEAKAWLLEVDELLGAGFHVDNYAGGHYPPMSLEFELNRFEFIELAQRENFCPYGFAMENMPSFVALRQEQTP